MTEHAQLPENHASYQKHRRQFWLQIFLPMLLSILGIVAVAVLTSVVAFGNNGDSPRWAAISTIWLVIPIMIFGLIVLAGLIGMAYLLAQALKAIPPYTAKGQYYVNRAVSAIRRASDAAVKPVFYLEGIIASIEAFFGKK